MQRFMTSKDGVLYAMAITPKESQSGKRVQSTPKRDK